MKVYSRLTSNCALLQVGMGTPTEGLTPSTARSTPSSSFLVFLAPFFVTTFFSSLLGPSIVCILPQPFTHGSMCLSAFLNGYVILCQKYQPARDISTLTVLHVAFLTLDTVEMSPKSSGDWCGFLVTFGQGNTDTQSLCF